MRVVIYRLKTEVEEPSIIRTDTDPRSPPRRAVLQTVDTAHTLTPLILRQRVARAAAAVERLIHPLAVPLPQGRDEVDVLRGHPLLEVVVDRKHDVSERDRAALLDHDRAPSRAREPDVAVDVHELRLGVRRDLVEAHRERDRDVPPGHPPRGVGVLRDIPDDVGHRRHRGVRNEPRAEYNTRGVRIRLPRRWRPCPGRPSWGDRTWQRPAACQHCCRTRGER